MSIKKAIPREFLREISIHDIFGEHQSLNWTGSFGRCSRSDINIPKEECAVPLDTVSLVTVGIYKREVTFERKLLVELRKSLFGNAE